MNAQNITNGDITIFKKKNYYPKFKIFKETFLSLIFDLGGLIAGAIMGYYVSLISVKTWAIAIYPIVLTGRGALNGILGGKLSTGLHLGLINTNIKKNTKYFYSLLASLCLISLITSFIVGIIAFIITGALIEDLYTIVISCIAIQALTILITIPITSVLGFITFKRGFDPDIVVFPISSTVADIWATISYLITLSMVFWFGSLGMSIIYFISLFFIIFVIVLAFLFRREREYWYTLKEALFTILIITLISAISGFSLSKMRDYIKKSPGIIVVYPALIDTLGDAAAIFGSISTTRLFIGFIKSKIGQIRRQTGILSQILIATFLFYIIYGFIAFIYEKTLISFFMPIVSFLLCFPIVIIITFIMAILTFTKGMNPDNFVIPIETALTDAIFTVVIATLIILLY
ncbi:MAG: magnesium transporter [Candidatus Helarchaeota archaeon]